MKRILLIDPDKDLSKYLTAALRDYGYDASAVSKLTDAATKEFVADYDLVICEYAFYSVNNKELTAENIRDMCSDIPIIILSREDGWNSKIRGLTDMGADDYVTKPFHIGELTARVEALLRRA